MIDIPETQHQQSVAARGSNSRAIAVTCTQHSSAGFTNLMVGKREGAIVLNPHVAGPCVIILDETAATGPVRPDRGMARMSTLGSLALRGSPADPRQVRPNCAGGTR